MKSISRVLVIDDNESIHEDFRKVFASESDGPSDAALAFLGEGADEEERTPYEVGCASQGEIGLAMLTEAISVGRPFDMAFVDMRMPPGWDGVETIQHLWEADPFLEVVICSAYSDYSWHGIVEELGLSDRYLIIRKPFDNTEVLQAAASLCQKRRLKRENAAYRRDLEQKVREQTQSLQEAMARMTESQQFLNASLDAMAAGIAIIDESGTILFRNKAWTESRSTLVANCPPGHSNYLDFCNRHRGELEVTARLIGNSIQEVGSGRTDGFLREYKQHAGGAQSWFTVRVSPFGDAAPGHVVVLHEDVTEHKLLEAQLGQARKLQSIGQLAAGLAAEVSEADESQIGADCIEKRSDKLLELVSVALQFGNAESQSESLESLETELRSQAPEHSNGVSGSATPDTPTPDTPPEPGTESQVSRIAKAVEELSQVGRETRCLVDINEVLETARILSTHEWKGVTEVELELDDTLRPIIGLPGELNQVFLNLIVNATHAIADQAFGDSRYAGRIVIRSSQTAEMVRVEVSDNGGGIPESIQSRVFDPFFTTKSPARASGHGLAIARGVVIRKHNGRITFDVQVGVGTTFTVELPIDSTVSVQGAAASACPANATEAAEGV